MHARPERRLGSDTRYPSSTGGEFKELKGRSRFGLRGALAALVLILAVEDVAFGSPVDLDSGEGYSVGNLEGQPTA
jgi:hypothetical protein